MLHSFPTTADHSQVYPLVSTRLPGTCNCSCPIETDRQWVFSIGFFPALMAAITLYLSDFTDKRMTSTTAAWVTTSGLNTDVPPPTSSEERWTWSAQKSSVCSLDPSTCPLPVAANCAMSARTWSPTPGSTSTYPPPRSKTRIPPHCDNWRHDEDNWMTSLPASCLHCVVCPTIVESSPKCHIFF